jgi:hypothetical protein
MQSGPLWRQEIDDRLNATTHFIALLCDAYWDSEECRRELHFVLKRFEGRADPSSHMPRLLFVRAGEMDPSWFTFDEARRVGALSSEDPRINKLSDVNFLGPFDFEGHRKLEILDWENQARLDRQLGQLRDRFRQTL